MLNDEHITNEAFPSITPDDTYGKVTPEQLVDKESIPHDTILADAFPRIDMPLRMDPPPSMKAPLRTDIISKDKQIRDTAFSPGAFISRNNISNYLSTREHVNPNDIKDIKINSKEHTEAQGVYNTNVQDLKMLAFSSQRAGRKTMEASAYFSIAVLHDNKEKFEMALPFYQNFLQVCRDSNDTIGESLGYNNMGINYMFLACNPRQGNPFESAQDLSEQSKKYLELAVECHMLHLRISDDGGQFVSNTNLGICMGILSDFTQAARYHQDALKIAIRLQSFHAQSIAVGNLGLLAMRQGDSVTAKACLEQHLQLVQGFKDKSAEIFAWCQLGDHATYQKDYEKAILNYEQAKAVAKIAGEIGTVKRINCNIGMAQGHLHLNEHMKKLAELAS